ncbi:hypothetical protein LDB17_026 [Lactobacillus phage Ld17]|uniref:Uncharacterized protein n=2 Tax=Cequinquevirus TaxID=1912760 RepID=A0A075KJV8_9CAUD|nr:hypothetical protein LDB17_026 [Lactobacillus phage Ld17]YP_009098734.1 hypothetical protein LDB3_025 [Lactobacillus phage Ld3]AIF54401.1 hypothetical protein LDB17_026 [Lactobacillus phage Ld17]AIF54450.1 hypothetical protein LDB3_025 [Lactobacillus phage Ld3]
MSDLIKVDNGVATLNSNVTKQIAEFETQIKAIKKQEEDLKKSILDAMKENGVIKIDNEHLTINYIAGHDQERFDTKAFKEENRMIYDEYVKMVHVKDSVRIKVKD